MCVYKQAAPNFLCGLCVHMDVSVMSMRSQGHALALLRGVELEVRRRARRCGEIMAAWRLGFIAAAGVASLTAAAAPVISPSAGVLFEFASTTAWPLPPSPSWGASWDALLTSRNTIPFLRV
jgi:hypothetical protein